MHHFFMNVMCMIYKHKIFQENLQQVGLKVLKVMNCHGNYFLKKLMHFTTYEQKSKWVSHLYYFGNSIHCLFQTCPLCSSELVGPNTALMKVAELVFGEKYNFEELADDDSFDITVKPVFEEEESIDFKEPALDSLKEVKNLENI